MGQVTGSTIISVLVSIVVSIPACHAGDPGSIPGRGAFSCFVGRSQVGFVGRFGRRGRTRMHIRCRGQSRDHHRVDAVPYTHPTLPTSSSV